MKTIFVKYSKERLAKFQTMTKIIQNKKGERFVIKELINIPDIPSHLDNMYDNYELLSSKYNVNLVKPKKTSSGLIFDMAKGSSFENLILECIEKNNLVKLKYYLESYLELINNMSTSEKIKFNPCENFKNIFGTYEKKEAVEILNPANIDLIFSNIFYEDNQFTIIDYEWIFHINIPKNYIIWRALSHFNNSHNIDLSEYFDIDLNNPTYQQMEENFCMYVNGPEQKYLIKSVLKKPVHSLDTLNSTSYIKLLLNNQLIKKHILNTFASQSFIFNIYTANIDFQTFRLYLLDNSCLIEIEELFLSDKNHSIINLRPYIKSNASRTIGNKFYFESVSPEISLNNFTIQSVKDFTINAKIRYVNIGKEALRKSIEIIKKEHFNQKVVCNDLLLLLKNTGNFKIVFFGASSGLKKRWQKFIDLGLNPDFICDNDVKKHGEYFNEYKIFSSNQIFNLADSKQKYLVIITSEYFNEITEQLNTYSNIGYIVKYKDII
ncbi:MAG: hypothetical protein ACNI28_05485 [Arcobacter sp.]|uniref:hypothetical protein n=1 Tax=Arcobacter sp. TaxID=1872629 RepID=UPI003AFF9056